MIYDQILLQIVSQFKFVSEDNIKDVQMISKGFSGAEVYTIELSPPSERTGKFFLKIDEQDEEFCHAKISDRFPCSSKYIQSAHIDNYYVLLEQIAGNSCIEYKSFYDSPSDIRSGCVSEVIKTMLESSIEKKTFCPNEEKFSKVCGDVLGSKLSGPIDDFLRLRLANPDIPTISLRADIFPNALYFAKQDFELRDCYYLPALSHGDFHGENVFLAQNSINFSVIDWALANENGYLFYDNAYFELSALLYFLKDCALDEWVDILKDICDRRYNKIEYKVIDIVENLHNAENDWINQINDTAFSHVDKMKVGQYVARVLAGLNFAGKKKVEPVKKEKAFLFSCIYLKKLFELADFIDWENENTERWNTYRVERPSDISIAQHLARYCTQFSEQYQYILLCGRNLALSEESAEFLTRIPWTGIITLSSKTNENLYEKINELKLLRNLLPNQSASDLDNNIEYDATWWMFANGFDNDLDTLTNTFGQWRNKNSIFLQTAVSKICSASSPQDIMLILDFESLDGEEDRQKIQRILEYFDQEDNSNTLIAELAPKGNTMAFSEGLENISSKRFSMNLELLAYYASLYRSAVSSKRIWLPHVDKKTGIQLDEKDEKYITSYINIIGDHLLGENIDYMKKRAFYWGEAITWDAIKESIPVDRPEIEKLIAKIQEAINAEKWGHVDLGHTPGAGATVLSKSICWKMRKQYPVIQITHLGIDAFESMIRISNLTGCPIIILVDGDFTRNDIETIEETLKTRFVKFIILYTFRLYSYDSSNSSQDSNKEADEILDILQTETALNFESHYGREMELKNCYSEKQLTDRKDSLHDLTIDNALVEFRSPFFYGMYAFEDDFKSIQEYTTQILDRAKHEPEFRKVINYISLITAFTAERGLSDKAVRKILRNPDLTAGKVLRQLNDKLPNFVYVTNNTYRICHPVIARKILINQFGANNSLSTIKFTECCKEFIQDIREIEGGNTPSEYVLELITDIFITRGYVDTTEASNSYKVNTTETQEDELRSSYKKDVTKSSFAPIMQMVNNENLQKDIFACLVKEFPNNSHCFQHYGRLLISNTPSNLVAAKEQFDQAIKLDGENPLHFHARGTMYQKHCKYLLDSKYNDDSTLQDVYNGCKQIVELALSDFEKAIDLASKNRFGHRQKTAFLLSYPYSSILNLCTMMIRKMQNIYKLKNDIDQFWEQKTDAIEWCRTLLAIASRYDIKTENEHPEVKEDKFYRSSHNNLLKIKFTPSEIQKLIKKNPDDITLKFIYLGKVDTRKDALKKKKNEEYTIIQKYCEDVINQYGPDGGILWKWFNVYILMNDFDYAHAIALLETLPDIESNLTANYLLSIAYFCKFYKMSNTNDATKSLYYIEQCKKLSYNDPYRRSSKCFLTKDSEILPLTTNRDTATQFSCTIIEEVTRDQGAEMVLDMDRRFKVFFVPYYNKAIRMGQGFSQQVNATIGFSYSGLRGFDLTLQK